MIKSNTCIKNSQVSCNLIFLRWVCQLVKFFIGDYSFLHWFKIKFEWYTQVMLHFVSNCSEESGWKMSKYGLNLRPPKPKKQPPRPSLANPFGFNEDDENDVEREIALQASKNKRLKEVCWSCCSNFLGVLILLNRCLLLWLLYLFVYVIISLSIWFFLF